MRKISLDEIVSAELDFYGVCGNRFKLGHAMGTQVFEALEDANDGYRSCLESVGSIAIDPKDIFFPNPVARVKVCAIDAECFDGYYLECVKTGHVWLKLGTNRDDSCYPTFVFNYEPDQTQTIDLKSRDTAFEDFVKSCEGQEQTARSCFEAGWNAVGLSGWREHAFEVATAVDFDLVRKYAPDTGEKLDKLWALMSATVKC